MKNQTNIHINAPKDRALALKAQVTALLKWNDQGYADLQYTTGMKYLKLFLEGDEHMVDVLSASKVFWQWWRNHWMNRDQEFLKLHGNIYINNLEVRRQLYVQYNGAKMLAECIHPNSVVMNESYTEMIHSLVKTETQAA